MSDLIGVDVGGTFTDVVLIRDGKVHVTKVPSTPARPELAVLEGARRNGVSNAALFNHASTTGLNAILTRNIPKIGFLTTDGHRDMLDAGRAWRPWKGQLDPRWRRSFGDAARPLVQRYLRRGVVERMRADGEILIPLDEEQALQEINLLKRCNVDCVAICLLNSYVNPAHEVRLAKLAREVLGPEVMVSVSYQVGARAKEYARASTTVVDALMKLVYTRYAAEVFDGLSGQNFAGQLNFADCTAALIPWRDALDAPHRILFAGPAAGAASCTALGKVIGDGNLIGCDVGGTSTDVTMIVDHQPFVDDSFEVEWDLVVNALATEVSSVGAGGGSIVMVSPSGDLTVGPQSAGADPGAACYGRGGTRPTVTDACLLMGILDPHDFADGQMELDVDASRRAFEALDCAIPADERVALAWRVALNNIAEEVVNIAIRHGADPRDFSLVAFGSGGPMLLAGALELVGARRMIVPPNPGLFSALGLLSTDLSFTETRSSYRMLAPENVDAIHELLEEMERVVRGRVGGDVPVQVKRSFDGRLAGQSWETPFVPIADGAVDADAMSAAFHAEYVRRNGEAFPEVPVQGVTWRVQLIAPSTKYQWATISPQVGTPQRISRRTLHHLAEEPTEADIFERSHLGCGASILGPAIIREPLSTILVLPDQVATIGRFGEIIIEKRA